MNSIILKSAEDLHYCLRKYLRSSNYKFRGQSKADWKLIPKAGRYPFTNVRDSEMFRQWKRRGTSLLQGLTSNFDLLVGAQHTGLPTRLLDWSHNPLIGAFFAAYENFDEDGAIWIVKPSSYFYDNSIDPFSLPKGEITFYQPSSSLSRALNQFSYFSIHNDPSLELTYHNSNLSVEIDQIVIPKGIKKDLVFLLNHYGINYLTIYPDLEGLSKHLSWFAENYEFWNNSIDS